MNFVLFCCDHSTTQKRMWQWISQTPERPQWSAEGFSSKWWKSSTAMGVSPAQTIPWKTCWIELKTRKRQIVEIISWWWFFLDTYFLWEWKPVCWGLHIKSSVCFFGLYLFCMRAFTFYKKLEKASLESVITANNWFSSKHLKPYTKRQLHLSKYIKHTEMYKTYSCHL